MVTEDELVYQLSHQFLIDINQGLREAHIPSKGGFPECVWKHLTLYRVLCFYDGHLGLDGCNVLIWVAVSIKLG